MTDAGLLARRLLERGGVRVVQLGFAPDIAWDDHGDILWHIPKAKNSWLEADNWLRLSGFLGHEIQDWPVASQMTVVSSQPKLRCRFSTRWGF